MDGSIKAIKVTNYDYANSAPKIMLEIISARSATLIIFVTYSVFIVGFLFDVFTTFQSFHGSKHYLPGQSCSSLPIPVEFDHISAGCYTGQKWQGIVTDLKNVISVQLDVKRYNISSLNSPSDSDLLVYNVDLWACYQANGCGNTFTGYGDHNWMAVLSNTNNTATVTKVRDEDYLSTNIFPITFQNQESIPTQGLVQSYYVSVNYLADEYRLFYSNPDEITYTFDIISRPEQNLKNTFVVILMFCFLVVFCGYIYIVYTYNKASSTPWLSEQKWLVVYFLAVLLYQNPVSLVIDFSNTSTPTAAYSSYMLDQISQALLFVIWLLFADSIHRTTKSLQYFYFPKLFFGIVIFVVGVFTLTCQFPSLDPVHGRSKNPVEAVSNWSHDLKLIFCIFSISFIILQWLWTFTWFTNIYYAYKTLNKLPYMSTRYLQLSHRFFFIQAISVTFYYVFQYLTVIVLLGQNDSDGAALSLTGWSDNINTLFREQTQLFGKILFLTTYALVLAFLFLPASFGDSTFIMQNVLFKATFVITEMESQEVKRQRLLAKHQSLLTLNPAGFLSNLTSNITNNLLKTKVEVFCVDTALILRELSYQAYYDPHGIHTESSYEGDFDIHSSGFKMVETHYCQEHQGFCYIAREINYPRRLVVVFRGTVSRRQMEDNLNYTRRELNLFNLRLNALDGMDGLNPDPTTKLHFNDINTLSEAIHEPFDPSQQTRNRRDSERISSGEDEDHNHDPSESQSVYHLHPDDHQHNHNQRFFRDTFVDGATAVERGVTKVANNIKGATTTVIGTTAGAVVEAASYAPGLKGIIRTCIHMGFWDAYETSLRIFVHATLRRELANEPADVVFTGHSLGGAIATFAALDFTIHTLPRIKSHLKNTSASQDIEHNSSTPTASSSASAKYHVRPSSLSSSIHVMMYNFGAPKVGNSAFMQLYDRILPDSFRVVVDGDLVTGLPPSWNYRHIGTPVYIDSSGTGSIIIDPSFVELWLRIQTRASIANHSLLVYKKGLDGVKAAAKYIAELAGQKKYDMKTFIRLSIFNEKKSSDNIIDSKIQEDMSSPTASSSSALIPGSEAKGNESIIALSTITPFANIHDHSNEDDDHDHDTLSYHRSSGSYDEHLHDDDHDGDGDHSSSSARHLANDMRNVDYLLKNMKQVGKTKSTRRLRSGSTSRDTQHDADQTNVGNSINNNNLSWKMFHSQAILRPDMVLTGRPAPLSKQDSASSSDG